MPGRGSQGPELDWGKQRSASEEGIFQVRPEGAAGTSQVEHECGFPTGGCQFAEQARGSAPIGAAEADCGQTTWPSALVTV